MLFRSPVPTLSLKTFTVDPDSRTLIISGRVSGLVGFLLNLAKISPTTTFTLLFDRLELDEATITSQSKKLFPLAATSSTECGTRQPISYLVMAAIMAYLTMHFIVFSIINGEYGSMALSLVFAIIGAIAVVGYLFSRKLYLAVHCGSQSMEIIFKESVIGKMKVDRDAVLEAIEIINDRIIEAKPRN